MKETNKWNPDEYTKHTGFVSKLALPVVDLLETKKSEAILDVGCGDGELAIEIQSYNAKVIGIDSSSEMVQKSNANGIEAYEYSVTDLPYKERFDAVFSNATLHWVKEPNLAIQNIAKALKKGGRFVCEFGGEGNVYHIVKALEASFKKRPEFGEFVNPWYFPSPTEYKSKLEHSGFKVEYIELIPRPTPMKDAGKWLDIFANGITKNLTTSQYSVLKKEALNYLKEHIYTQKDGWMLDYVRLRVKAIKL